jgi:kynureninase
MARLTEAAHRKKIVIGFDCCHSVGVVPHYLGRWGVDFAFWCYNNNGNCSSSKNATKIS